MPGSSASARESSESTSSEREKRKKKKDKKDKKKSGAHFTQRSFLLEFCVSDFSFPVAVAVPERPKRAKSFRSKKVEQLQQVKRKSLRFFLFFLKTFFLVVATRAGHEACPQAAKAKSRKRRRMKK